jgi:hypothetical protein
MKRAVTKSLEEDKLHQAIATPVSTNPSRPLQHTSQQYWYPERPRYSQTCTTNGLVRIVKGYAVVHLIEAQRYKPESRGFTSRWNFSLNNSFQPNYGPGVDPASNRNKYEKCFLGGRGCRCVRLTNLPPLCADCLESLKTSTCWIPKDLSRRVMG